MDSGFVNIVPSTTIGWGPPRVGRSSKKPTVPPFVIRQDIYAVDMEDPGRVHPGGIGRVHPENPGSEISQLCADEQAE